MVVKVAKLAQGLESYTIKGKAPRLDDFLASKNIEFDKSVLVNGKRVAKGYSLKNGDIITVISSVTGGK